MSGCERCLEGSTPCEVVTVAAVDDHRVVLDGIRARLARDAPGIRLTVDALTVDALLADPTPLASVVLLDVRLGDGSDVADNVRRIVDAGAQVLLFTGEARRAPVGRAIGAGALGVVLKEDDPASLVEAIGEAHRGRFAVSSALADEVANDPRGRVRFTPQQLAVLEGRATGLGWDHVARGLGIRPGTAREYAGDALRRYSEALGEPVPGPGALLARAIADGHVDLRRAFDHPR